jgi:outer membrane lipoprotein carrier protein
VKHGGRAVWRTGGQILLAAAALCSADPAVGLSAQVLDPLAIMDGAGAAFARVNTLSAEFVQVITNPLIDTPDTTRGTLYQRRPNFFEMRFTKPKNDRIVADGHYLWLYTPSTTPGQVIRAPIPSTGTTGPNLIGQFVDRARERYNARLVRTDTLAEGADVIALEPKGHDLPYREAVLWIGRSDSLVRRLDITETSGQQRTVMLRTLLVNGPISEREFLFLVPAGVQVIAQ